MLGGRGLKKLRKREGRRVTVVRRFFSFTLHLKTTGSPRLMDAKNIAAALVGTVTGVAIQRSAIAFATVLK